MKKCNHCGTTENLMIDKLERIYAICYECRTTIAKKAFITKTGKPQKESSIYFKKAKNGSVIYIDRNFFEEEYIDKNVILEDLEEKYKIRVSIFKKYLAIYGIKEHHLCRYCRTSDNLLFREGRICNCCTKCHYEKNYIGRKPSRIKKEIKPRKLIGTSGIGIVAQFLFKDLELELNKRNIEFDVMQYGFFDLKLNKRTKSEKSLKMYSPSGKPERRRRFLDCYIEINNKVVILEFDEYRHKEEKNQIKDLEREKEIKESFPNYLLYRIDQEILRDFGRSYIIDEIIKLITKLDNNNLFLSNLDWCAIYEEQDRAFQQHQNEIYDNNNFF